MQTAPARARPHTAVSVASDSYAEMMARFLGSDVMAVFDDDDVTEIYLNPHDGMVRTDTRSKGRVSTGHMLDPHRVEMFLNAAAASLNATVTMATPSLQSELPIARFRGSRLQGFVSPATIGPAFNIRKPPGRVFSLEDYCAAGILTARQRGALAAAIAAHENILIAGGTNSGKTTLANALLREITDRCPEERIVVLEDTVELRCSAPDHLALRTGPAFTLADLVRATMRTSPNRIVVGEVRGAEALDLLDAWATGHPGGIGTCHATTAEGALLRLDRLAQRNNIPSQMALIAEAIHLVVVMEGGNQSRRVADLARVRGLDRDNRAALVHLNTEGDWA